MGDRKDFSQTELLKYLGQFTVNRARCEKCGKTVLDRKLSFNLHKIDIPVRIFITCKPRN